MGDGGGRGGRRRRRACLRKELVRQKETVTYQEKDSATRRNRLNFDMSKSV